MTENATADTTEGTTEPQDDGLRPPQFDAPKDAPEATSTGYAVYDRTLGRFVGSVVGSKPSARKAQEAAPGHTVAVVRV